MIHAVRRQIAAIRKALPAGSVVGLDLEVTAGSDGSEEVSWCCHLTVPGQRTIVGIGPSMGEAVAAAMAKRFEQMGTKPLDVVAAKFRVQIKRPLQRLSMN